jgi:hypothetical protein
VFDALFGIVTTGPDALITRDTVAIDNPEWAARSSNVGFVRSFSMRSSNFLHHFTAQDKRCPQFERIFIIDTKWQTARVL